MREVVAAACHNPVDYSPTFTSTLAELSRALEARLDAAVDQDADMNYRAGQLLVLYSDRFGAFRRRRDEDRLARFQAAGFLYQFFVSSRGRFFALRVLEKVSLQEAQMPAALPNGVSMASRRVAELLCDQSYTEVADSELNEIVPGAFTELDGAPATVSDVLFGEIW